MGLRWIDPNSDNSCETCLHYADRVFPDGEELPLPAHPNCECFYEQTSEPGEPIDWDDEPEHARRTYVLYVAWLLRNDEPVPAVLEPLRAEAEEHNKNREESRYSMIGKILTFAAPGRVDRQQHVIRGVSLIQAVEALGHGMMVDDVTLGQVVALGNGRSGGLKSRFTHPGLSADGLGKFLGRVHGLFVQGDKVLGNLHLSESSANSPSGDLRGYVESLANEDPEAFGMSIVFTMDTPGWIVDGVEVRSWQPVENAENELPLVRIEELHASDVVDEPAANRDGLFAVGAFSGTTSDMAAQVFSLLDEGQRMGLFGLGDVEQWLQGGGMVTELPAPVRAFMGEFDFSSETAVEFGWKYVQARQVRPVQVKAGNKMSEELEVKVAALEAQLAESKGAEEEAAATVTRLEEEARAKRFDDLVGSGDLAWAGERSVHLSMLALIVDEHGEDSDMFVDYVRVQKALTAQLATSKLLEDVGSGRGADSTGDVAVRLDKLAASLSAEEGISYEKAYTRVLEQNPKFYQQYLTAE